MIPQKFRVGQNFELEIYVQKASTFSFSSWIRANEGSKFKQDCVESENSDILLINAINLKLRLIDFVYFFFRHPVEETNVVEIKAYVIDIWVIPRGGGGGWGSLPRNAWYGGAARMGRKF